MKVVKLGTNSNIIEFKKLIEGLIFVNIAFGFGWSLNFHSILMPSFPDSHSHSQRGDKTEQVTYRTGRTEKNVAISPKNISLVFGGLVAGLFSLHFHGLIKLYIFE